jgi:hypothetical protein
MEAHWITPGRAYYAQLVNETAQNALDVLDVLEGMSVGGTVPRKEFARRIAPYDAPTALKVIDDLESIGRISVSKDLKTITRLA